MTKKNKPGANNKKARINKSNARRAQLLEQAARHHRLRDFAQAERLYLELIRENSLDIDANMQLAQMYRQAGRGDLALPLLRNAVLADSGDADTCNRLGILWHQAGQPQSARENFEKALALRPESIEFRFNLGLALRDLQLHHGAVDCFSRNLQAHPDHLPSLLQLGVSLRDIDRLQESLEVFQRAAALNPHDFDIYKYLAVTHVDLAHIDEAIRCWEKALEIDPECSLAHLRLSHLRKDRHDIAGMTALYEKAKKNIDKINLAFGLGKALEDSGSYDQAFRYLLEGNQLKRRQFRYSIDEWRDFFAKLQRIFSADFLKGFQDAGVEDDTPIFIVGMPRSGSSLVEQILASHPQVFGAGELKLLPSLCAQGAQRRRQPFPDYFRDLRGSEWRELGEEYLQALRQRSADAARITDKMPQNFRFLGVISIILPRAKIVHCSRHPLDNCWSIYKNLFAEGHPYAYDLSELGKFYSYYHALMRHWNEVLPGRIYNLSYEQLVGDPQGEIAALLEFCNLPFDQRCVDFHRSERAVDTMSAAQVKRPINSDSVERWALYKDHLAPLSRELSLN